MFTLLQTNSEQALRQPPQRSTGAGCAAVALAVMLAWSSGVTAAAEGPAARSPAFAAKGAKATATASGTLTSSANPSSYGASVTFTLTLSGTAGTPTGSATFRDGGAAIGGCSNVSLNANGVAACTTNLTGVSTHAITADYTGDANYFNASYTLPGGQVVNALGQTITFNSPPVVAVAGTATLTATGGGSGNPVVFASQNPGVCTTTGANGSTLTGVMAGICVVRASQAGNAIYNAAANVDRYVAIGTQVTTASVSSSPNPSRPGQSVTITASVLGNSPTGTMAIRVTGASCPTTTLTGTANGKTATCVTDTLPTGSSTINIEYSGDASNNTVTSSGTHQVSGNQLTINLSASPATISYGQSTTVTAAVSGDVTTSDKVAFYVDGVLSSSCAAQSIVNTLATCTLAGLTAGQHYITAKVDVNSATTNVAVSKVKPSLTVTATSTTASLSAAAVSGGVAPTGNVAFSARSTSCNASLSGSGASSTASCALAMSGPSGTQLSATYYGDVNYESAVATTTYASVLKLPPAGWYWNAAASGRGYFLEVNGDRVFFASMLYTTGGAPLWVVATGKFTQTGDTSTFSAPLQTFKAGQTLTGPYFPAASDANLGTVTLTLKSDGTGTLTWPGESFAVTRFPFNGGVNGANDAETGWYWNPDEPGRGVAIEVQNGKMFTVFYLYDQTGAPTWYYADATTTDGRIYQGRWQQFGNGQSMGGAYQAPSVTNANVGSLTFVFNGKTSALLTLPDGRQINLQRFTTY